MSSILVYLNLASRQVPTGWHNTHQIFIFILCFILLIADHKVEGNSFSAGRVAMRWIRNKDYSAAAARKRASQDLRNTTKRQPTRDYEEVIDRTTVLVFGKYY